MYLRRERRKGQIFLILIATVAVNKARFKLFKNTGFAGA